MRAGAVIRSNTVSVYCMAEEILLDLHSHAIYIILFTYFLIRHYDSGNVNGEINFLFIINLSLILKCIHQSVFSLVIIIYSIIALLFQPIRSRCMRWLFLNNHLLKMNNHLPLQFTPRISVSWMVCRTMTCSCFGCSALPLDLVNLFIAVSL